MRRTGFTWLQLIGVLALIVIAAAILFPIFARSRENDGRPSCQQNVRQLGLAIKQYLSDYDESFPIIAIVNSVTSGWADGVQPYARNVSIFQCPNEQSPQQKTPDGFLSGYTDYWYNAHLAGMQESDIKLIANVLLIGDGNDGHELTDARYVKYSLAPDWYTDKRKPTFRHLDGANYSFIDGHVKWLKPSQITTRRPTKAIFTFLPR